MDSNSKKKEKRKSNLTAQNEMGVIIVMGMLLLMFFYTFIVAGNEKVLIEQYRVSSPIDIEAHDIGTKLESQTITFENEDGETVAIEHAVFDGSTDAKDLYVYRIGKWEWLSRLNVKQYYVTNCFIQEEEGIFYE